MEYLNGVLDRFDHEKRAIQSWVRPLRVESWFKLSFDLGSSYQVIKSYFVFYILKGPNHNWTTPFCTGCNSSTFAVWYTVSCCLDRLKDELVKKVSFWWFIIEYLLGFQMCGYSMKALISQISWCYWSERSLIQKRSLLTELCVLFWNFIWVMNWVMNVTRCST